MPNYLVKPVQGEDFYVVWSTVVSGVTDAGSIEHLAQARPDMTTEQHVTAADERGTSAPEIDGFADMAFGQEGFAIASDTGIALVARKDLRAYLGAEESGEDTTPFVAHSLGDDGDD